jgi:hypothetical protein
MTRAEILEGIKKSRGITAPPSRIEFSLGDIWTDATLLPTEAWSSALEVPVPLLSPNTADLITPRRLRRLPTLGNSNRPAEGAPTRVPLNPPQGSLSEASRSSPLGEELIMSTDSPLGSMNTSPTTMVAGEEAEENKTHDSLHYTTRLQEILSSPRAISLSGIDGLRPGNSLPDYLLRMGITTQAITAARWAGSVFGCFRGFKQFASLDSAAGTLFSILELLADMWAREKLDYEQGNGSSFSCSLALWGLLKTVYMALGGDANRAPDGLSSLARWFRQGLILSDIPDLFAGDPSAVIPFLQRMEGILRYSSLRSKLMEIFPSLSLLSLPDLVDCCCSGDSLIAHRTPGVCLAKPGKPAVLLFVGPLVHTSLPCLRLYLAAETCLGTVCKPVVELGPWKEGHICTIPSGRRRILTRIQSLTTVSAIVHPCRDDGSIIQEAKAQKVLLKALGPPSQSAASRHLRDAFSLPESSPEPLFWISWPTGAAQVKAICNYRTDDNFHCLPLEIDVTLPQGDNVIGPMCGSCGEDRATYCAGTCHKGFHYRCLWGDSVDPNCYASLRFMCPNCSVDLLHAALIADPPDCLRRLRPSPISRFVGKATINTQVLRVFEKDGECTDLSMVWEKLRCKPSDEENVCMFCSKGLLGVPLLPCISCGHQFHWGCCAWETLDAPTEGERLLCPPCCLPMLRMSFAPPLLLEGNVLPPVMDGGKAWTQGQWIRFEDQAYTKYWKSMFPSFTALRVGVAFMTTYFEQFKASHTPQPVSRLTCGKCSSALAPIGGIKRSRIRRFATCSLCRANCHVECCADLPNPCPDVLFCGACSVALVRRIIEDNWGRLASYPDGLPFHAAPFARARPISSFPSQLEDAAIPALLSITGEIPLDGHATYAAAVAEATSRQGSKEVQEDRLSRLRLCWEAASRRDRARLAAATRSGEISTSEHAQARGWPAAPAIGSSTSDSAGAAQ